MRHAQHLIDGVMSWTGFRRLVYALIPITALFLWLDVTTNGGNVQCWNWMYYTGVLTFAVAIALAIALPGRLSEAIDALKLNNSLILEQRDHDAISSRMQASARSWRFWCALLIFAVVLGSWIWALGTASLNAGLDWSAIAVMRSRHGLVTLGLGIGLIVTIILVMAACGFYAGAFFGVTAAHGGVAAILAEESLQLRIRPDHFDGASGLKPIGDLYLYQAFLTALPLLWFAAWWLVIPVYRPQGCAMPVDYSPWQWPFVVQWLVTLTFTYLAFVRPILKLRKRVIGEQRRLLSEVAPRLRAEIEELQATLLREGADPGKANALNDDIDRRASYLWSIRQMSHWPMDAGTQRRYFSVNALVTVVPPILGALSKIGVIAADLPDTGPLRWLKAVLATIL